MHQKFIISLLFFTFSIFPSFGQEIYTSPLTQHFPSAEMDTINRSILFEPETITIITETPRGEEKQEYTLVEKENKIVDPIGSAILYTCTSGDGEITTYFIIPKMGIPEFIDVVHPAQMNKPEKLYRFVLDLPVNEPPGR